MVTQFKNIEVGNKFYANGVNYVKVSSRTARIIEIGKLFYFSHNEFVKVK